MLKNRTNKKDALAGRSFFCHPAGASQLSDRRVDFFK